MTIKLLLGWLLGKIKHKPCSSQPSTSSHLTEYTQSSTKWQCQPSSDVWKQTANYKSPHINMVISVCPKSTQEGPSNSRLHAHPPRAPRKWFAWGCANVGRTMDSSWRRPTTTTTTLHWNCFLHQDLKSLSPKIPGEWWAFLKCKKNTTLLTWEPHTKAEQTHS